MLVFDPSAFPKKGRGRSGWAAAVVRPARQGRELPGRRLPRLRQRRRARPGRLSALPSPREWARRPHAAAKSPGVPKEVRFQRGLSWPWRCWDERGPLLPHGWVAGDDEMGRSSWFREASCGRGGECYFLAVPSNTAVRDYSLPTRRTRAGAVGRTPFVRVDHWCARGGGGGRGRRSRSGRRRRARCRCRPCGRWVRKARTEGRASDVAEVLVVFRERQGDGTWKHDYLLSNASPTTPWRSTRGCGAEHRIESACNGPKGSGSGGLRGPHLAGWHHPPGPGAWRRRGS